MDFPFGILKIEIFFLEKNNLNLDEIFFPNILDESFSYILDLILLKNIYIQYMEVQWLHLRRRLHTAAIDVERQLNSVFLFPPGSLNFASWSLFLSCLTHSMSIPLFKIPLVVHPSGFVPQVTTPQAVALGVVPTPGPLFSFSVPCCCPLS